jgi:aminoglycoside phosphotransferase (APT) family kinase protein
MPPSDKNAPAPAWIAELRRRFTVEPEIDRVLTRKLERRAGPGYVPQTLTDLMRGAASLIRADIGDDFSIGSARWLSGGASKLQVAFDLDWHCPGIGRKTTAMVLRMEPAASLVESSRLREFEIIRAMQGVVPVPPVFWVDAYAEHLPYPAIIYGFVDGVTKPRDATSQATGMATVMAPHWRATLGPQFVLTLARIHNATIDGTALSAFELPAPGPQSTERALDHWERVWEEDADEDIPLMRLAAAWLRANVPPCARPVVLHGDYRVGNFLFTEHDARFSAVLDWEMARIGDHHFDVAWAINPAYGHPAEDGRTLLVGGFMPEAEFLERYQRASGLPVDPRALYYHKVYCGWLQGVIAIASGWRVARNGKTHQDALVAWIVGIGPKLLAELRDLLERGM